MHRSMKGGSEADHLANRWLAGRRDFFVTNMYKGFQQTLAAFRTLYRDYLGSGHVSFDKVDALVGSENRKGRLWRLKDECHTLWREVDPHRDLNGCLLDWVMGSLFHEAMKLKENIYLFQYYAPLVREMKTGWQKESRRFCGVECQCFMERISRETARQMENIGVMFGQANYLLRIMLPDQGRNRLLLRFLVEHEEMVPELWCESLDEIFGDMYPGRPETGYLLAAGSYMEGNWYGRAWRTYERALAVNNSCREALEATEELGAMFETDPAAGKL